MIYKKNFIIKKKSNAIHKIKKKKQPTGSTGSELKIDYKIQSLHKKKLR